MFPETLETLFSVPEALVTLFTVSRNSGNTMHPEAPTNINPLYNHALNSFVLTKADVPTRWLLYFSFPTFTKECCLGIRQRPPPPVSGFCFFLFYEDEHFCIIINNIKTL